MMCDHNNFQSEVDVNRITHGDDDQPYRWMADVRIRCADCGIPMRFIGLPAGVDLTGASVSVNAEEARLAIAPRGHVLSEIEGGDVGFSVRKM